MAFLLPACPLCSLDAVKGQAQSQAQEEQQHRFTSFPMSIVFVATEVRLFFLSFFLLKQC